MAQQTKVDHYDRLYASGGFGYDANRPRWRAWVAQHYIGAFGLQVGERLLDIPCGDGFWTSVFAEFGFDACGVDLSPGGIDEACRRYPGIEFAVGDAEQDLPFATRSFDVVFSRGITHLHRPELFKSSSFRMARNLMGYVRPGGLLLVSYYTKRDGSQPDRHAQHPVSELVKLFEAAGDVFKIEVVDNFVQIGVEHRDAPRALAAPSSDGLARRVGRSVIPRVRTAAGVARRRLPAVRR